MRVAIDTNVLVYAEGEGDAHRCEASRGLIARLQPGAVVLPVQVLGELHRVLTRARRDPRRIRDAILQWSDVYATRDSSWTALQMALDLHADHQLPIWDGLILAVAAEERCRLLLSEDFQHGFTWSGVTVVNPFAEERHPLLELALTV